MRSRAAQGDDVAGEVGDTVRRALKQGCHTLGQGHIHPTLSTYMVRSRPQICCGTNLQWNQSSLTTVILQNSACLQVANGCSALS